MMNEVIKKNGITYGIILGVILALITATIYAIDLKLFVSGWIGASTFVVYLVIGIVLLTKTKKELNGIFSFKDAFPSGKLITVPTSTPLPATSIIRRAMATISGRTITSL